MTFTSRRSLSPCRGLRTPTSRRLVRGSMMPVRCGFRPFPSSEPSTRGGSEANAVPPRRLPGQHQRPAIVADSAHQLEQHYRSVPRRVQQSRRARLRSRVLSVRAFALSLGLQGLIKPSLNADMKTTPCNRRSMFHVDDEHLGVGVRLAGYFVPLCVLREPQLGTWESALSLALFFPTASKFFLPDRFLSVCLQMCGGNAALGIWRLTTTTSKSAAAAIASSSSSTAAASSTTTPLLSSTAVSSAMATSTTASSSASTTVTSTTASAASSSSSGGGSGAFAGTDGARVGLASAPPLSKRMAYITRRSLALEER